MGKPGKMAEYESNWKTIRKMNHKAKEPERSLNTIIEKRPTSNSQKIIVTPRPDEFFSNGIDRSE